MTDRATSLLRTVLAPVCALFPRAAGSIGQALPAAPHFNVPAIKLQGIILERPHADALPGAAPFESAMAATMYGGSFTFAGETVMALPDQVFLDSGASAAWRRELLRLDWLASFRASSTTLHHLFALRLITAWAATRPRYWKVEDLCSALLNLAIDAPAIALARSPAAVAVAQTAILMAQRQVQKCRPATGHAAFLRAAALLAAHLATGRIGPDREKLLAELSACLDHASSANGSINTALAMLAILEILADGLRRAGDPLATGLEQRIASLTQRHSILLRSDGSLAFMPTEARLPRLSPLPHASAIARESGHARLVGGKTALVVAFGESALSSPFQAELLQDGRPVLWLEARLCAGRGGTTDASLICAQGGSLLEISRDPQGQEKPSTSIFVSGDGSDIRFETAHDVDSDGACVLLHVASHARLSTTHNRNGALLTLGKSCTWQLVVRGGSVEHDGGTLRISAHNATRGLLNFALKRQHQPARKQSAGNSAAALLL